MTIDSKHSLFMVFVANGEQPHTDDWIAGDKDRVTIFWHAK